MKNDKTEKRGCLFIGSIVAITVILSVGATLWILNTWVFPKRFDPVVLNASEKRVLDQKLEAFDQWDSTTRTSSSQSDSDELQPEKYSEEGANRTIRLSERELNALLAENTDLASRAVIDLAENLASGKLLVNMDPDFPLLGGKTIKISAGMELAYREKSPIVVLKGVSVMGVPIPNAWLGGLKNVDLVREFGADEGFWKAFADGVDNVQVTEGNLEITLKE
ncbi:MAG: arginine N-succinyltransferase [Pseudomonadota bacterium]